MRFTVSGASGFIGRRLAAELESAGHQVHILGRSPRTGLPSSVAFSIWDPDKGPPPEESLAGAGAVVHLAGEPVAQRWTSDVKRKIRSSRVEGTARLVERLASLPDKPSVLVCASAVGYYGDRGGQTLTEQSPAGSGFLPEVCLEWEQAARRAEDFGIRVVSIRIGLVLGKGGGALAKMLPPFKAGVGGRLASGEQWMSWIHLDDLARLFRFAAETPSLRGPVNGTAPNPVTNSDFTRALGRALGRPAILPVPAFAVRLLFGEMAEILISSQKAIPQAAASAGFQFRHPELFPALKEITG